MKTHNGKYFVTTLYIQKKVTDKWSSHFIIFTKTFQPQQISVKLNMKNVAN